MDWLGVCFYCSFDICEIGGDGNSGDDGGGGGHGVGASSNWKSWLSLPASFAIVRFC